MSDTAKELRVRLDAVTADQSLKLTTYCVWALSIATEAITRIEQLERGIELANKSSAFIPDGINLLRLIEELGNEH